jgi:hypothetical protein
MRKFLALILCIFFASALVTSLGCEKKEESPPGPDLPEATGEAPAPSVEQLPQEETELPEAKPEVTAPLEEGGSKAEEVH